MPNSRSNILSNQTNISDHLSTCQLPSPRYSAIKLEMVRDSFIDIILPNSRFHMFQIRPIFSNLWTQSKSTNGNPVDEVGNKKNISSLPWNTSRTLSVPTNGQSYIPIKATETVSAGKTICSLNQRDSQSWFWSMSSN